MYCESLYAKMLGLFLVTHAALVSSEISVASCSFPPPLPFCARGTTHSLQTRVKVTSYITISEDNMVQLVSVMYHVEGFEKFYRRANLPPSLRQIVRFALELECFVRDCATSIENKKLQSKGIAMYAHSVSILYYG